MCRVWTARIYSTLAELLSQLKAAACSPRLSPRRETISCAGCVKGLISHEAARHVLVCHKHDQGQGSSVPTSAEDVPDSLASFSAGCFSRGNPRIEQLLLHQQEEDRRVARVAFQTKIVDLCAYWLALIAMKSAHTCRFWAFILACTYISSPCAVVCTQAQGWWSAQTLKWHYQFSFVLCFLVSKLCSCLQIAYNIERYILFTLL